MFKELIKTELEQMYDVAFDVVEGLAKNEPWFEVIPRNAGKSLFSIKFNFQNDIRLTMVLKPQDFSGSMLENMANASVEKKRSFCALAKSMISSNARIDMRINNNAVNPTDYTDWPLLWSKMSVKCVVFPLDQAVGRVDNLSEPAIKWSKLMIGLPLSLLTLAPLYDDVSPETEGAKKLQQSIRYERSRVNRAICLDKYGYTCQACGMNFEESYGSLGKDFIHVHHIIPVSGLGENYALDPLTELVPLCPNCHAMVHRVDPPMPIEQLKTIISENNSKRE